MSNQWGTLVGDYGWALPTVKKSQDDEHKDRPDALVRTLWTRTYAILSFYCFFPSSYYASRTPSSCWSFGGFLDGRLKTATGHEFFHFLPVSLFHKLNLLMKLRNFCQSVSHGITLHMLVLFDFLTCTRKCTCWGLIGFGTSEKVANTSVMLLVLSLELPHKHYLQPTSNIRSLHEADFIMRRVKSPVEGFKTSRVLTLNHQVRISFLVLVPWSFLLSTLEHDSLHRIRASGQSDSWADTSLRLNVVPQP